MKCQVAPPKNNQKAQGQHLELLLSLWNYAKKGVIFNPPIRKGRKMTDGLLLKRELERQEFLNEVKRFMMDHEEESNSQSGRLKAQIGWLIAIGDLFTTIEKLPPIKNTLTAGEYQTEITIFRTKIMIDIMRFSRTAEESILIVGQLFAWVSKSLVLHSRIPHQVQMADNPDLILQEKAEV